MSRAMRRYAITAGAAALVDLGGFAALVAAGAWVPLAAALSWFAANVVNYRLSARYAFGAAPTLRRYPRFLAAAGVGFAVNVAATVGLEAAGLPAPAAKAAAIGIAFALNYALAARLVFRPDR